MTKLKLFFLFISVLFSSLLLAQSDNGFQTKWSNGYKVTSNDKNFKMKFGGRIMWDNAFFSQDDDLEAAFGELKNGNEFRRVRFFNSGSIYNNVKYKLQLDFAGGKISFKDVYMTLGGIPVVGNLKVGHFKEPFRLEALTSSKYITFLERSFPTNMSQERNAGIMFYNDFMNKNISVQVGLFRNADSAGNDKTADDGYALTSRVTGLVLNNKEKHQLVHLGVGYSYRKPNSNEYKVSLRPEAHLGHKYISTGTLADVDNVAIMNLEAALVMSSLSIQGEFTQSSVSMDSETESINSFYAMASYFLTGEKRPYKGSYAGFSRVKPKGNFGDGGIGAWELALRYAAADFNGDNINGGQLADITIGLNWYLNPATRVMANFVMADVKDVGKANIFQTRFQIDF